MAVSAAAVKAAAALLQDKRTRKSIGTVIGVLAGIIILIIGAFFTIANSLSVGSHDVFGQIFSSGSKVKLDAPEENAKEAEESIRDIKVSFGKIENALQPVNERLGDQKVDELWVKSVFYALYFEQPQPGDDFYPAFVECFVAKTSPDDSECESPQTDETVLFTSIGKLTAIDITDETRQKAGECYQEAQAVLNGG